MAPYAGQDQHRGQALEACATSAAACTHPCTSAQRSGDPRTCAGSACAGAAGHPPAGARTGQPCRGRCAAGAHRGRDHPARACAARGTACGVRGTACGVRAGALMTWQLQSHSFSRHRPGTKALAKAAFDRQRLKHWHWMPPSPAKRCENFECVSGIRPFVSNRRDAVGQR